LHRAPTVPLALTNAHASKRRSHPAIPRGTSTDPQENGKIWSGAWNCVEARRRRLAAERALFRWPRRNASETSKPTRPRVGCRAWSGAEALREPVGWLTHGTVGAICQIYHASDRVSASSCSRTLLSASRSSCRLADHRRSSHACGTSDVHAAASGRSVHYRRSRGPPAAVRRLARRDCSTARRLQLLQGCPPPQPRAERFLSLRMWFPSGSLH
jgi:hypothetical protein